MDPIMNLGIHLSDKSGVKITDKESEGKCREDSRLNFRIQIQILKQNLNFVCYNIDKV